MDDNFWSCVITINDYFIIRGRTKANACESRAQTVPRVVTQRVIAGEILIRPKVRSFLRCFTCLLALDIR